MEHSEVNPSAAGGCKVEDPTGPPTRSQVDVTELCQRIPEGNSRLAPKVPDSVKSTCDMFLREGVLGLAKLIRRFP